MLKLRTFPMVDVTMAQTNKIEYLKRMVNDAETVLAKAQSKYDSFVSKANMFAGLYTEAKADKQTAESYWKQFEQVKSDLKALKLTSDETNRIAVDAFYGVKKLILEWENVVSNALLSAEAIMIAADYIQKRKASNPLISNELVSDATNAVKKAETTVKAVVKAFTSALSTLSSASSANNSTELTDVFIDLAGVTILTEGLHQDVLTQREIMAILSNPESGLTGVEAQSLTAKAMETEAMETSLKEGLDKATDNEKAAHTASEAANREMNKAKEELAQAQASLQTWEAALNAAETAVAG